MTSEEDSPADLPAVGAANRRVAIVLLSATVLGVLLRSVGSREFFVGNLAGTPSADTGTHAALWHFAAAFVLLGVVPALLVRLVLRERLSGFGVRLGDVGAGLRAAAALSPFLVAASWIASHQAPFRAEYPLNPAAADGAGAFTLHAAAYLLLYYTGWEFCFRGFLQTGLRGPLGDWNAILVQTSLSTALHVGKPLGETLGAVVGGVLWGVLALRTGSLLAGIVTHWVLGISLDFFLVRG